jgi:hypothetical protein
MISFEAVSKYFGMKVNPSRHYRAFLSESRSTDKKTCERCGGKIGTLLCNRKGAYATMPPSSQMKPSQARDLSRTQSIDESTDEEPGTSRRKRRLTVYDAVAGKQSY